MKRTAAVKISLIILSFLLAESITILSQAQQVYTKVKVVSPFNMSIIVDKNGKGDYDSIQDAIDNAVANTIIKVHKGVYKEILTINKPLTLIGEGRNSTIINPTSGKNKYAIYIGHPGVTIKNMGISNSGRGLYTMGIQISASNTKIENCNIFDVPVGIGIWSSNNIIANSSFTRCSDEGIALLGSLHQQVKNNIIINCSFRENNDGIELQYASENIIRNCDFINNSHDGISMIASSNNNNTILNCNMKNNGLHNIYITKRSSGNKIKNITSDDSTNKEMNSNSDAKHQNKIPYPPIFRVDLNGDGSGDISLVEFIIGIITGEYNLRQLQNIHPKLIFSAK